MRQKLKGLVSPLVAAICTLMLAVPRSADAILQPGDITAGNVIVDSSSAPYLLYGAGSPSLAYNPNIDRYYMVFEYKSANTSTICAGEQIWGLGLAYKDGINGTWIVLQQEILEPQPGSGTWWSCVAAHPTAIWSNQGGNINYNEITVFVKGEQDNEVCLGLNPNQFPSWGCERYTGLGVARVKLFNNGDFKRVNVMTNQELVLASQEFGYNNVIMRPDGTFILLVAMDNGEPVPIDRRYDIYTASSATLTGGWSINWTPTMTVDANSTWFVNELFTPEMFCADDIDGNGTDGIEVLMGGRRWGGAYMTVEGGLAQSYSADGYNWTTLPAVPTLSWFTNTEVRHVAGLAYGDDDLYLVAAEKSGTNLQIREYTAGNPTGTPRDRYCP